MRASLLLLPLVIVASSCGLVTDEVADTTASSLTTPTGANWIVLPRPAARTSSMFADAWTAPFISAGWSSTASVSTTTKVEGTSSLAVTLQAAWSAFGAGIDWAQQPYSGNGQTEVSFAFNAGAAVHAGIDTLGVAIEDDDAGTPTTYTSLKPYLVSSGNVAPSTWYRVTIPMSVLNPSKLPIRRLLIANRGTLTNVGFFVDDLKMSWTDPAPTERVVYADAAGASFSVSGWSNATATDPYRTTGTNALKSTGTASWGALDFVYDWNQPAFAAGTHTTVSFDVSGGVGTPPTAMNQLRVGLDTAPTKTLVSYVPGGFKANTWHRVTIPVTDLVTGAYRHVVFKNETTSLYSFYVDEIRLQTDHAPPPLRETTTPDGDPDTFAAGEVDVVTIVRTDVDRKPISPLIYGVNGFASDNYPSDVMSGVTLVRRGGDRGNSYNWETNVSNGSYNNGFQNDNTLSAGAGPASQDLSLLNKNRPAGRATMVPFVLNDWVSGPVGGIGAYDQPGWNRAAFFRRVGFTKPTPYAATPDLGDGMVYPDEHLVYMKNQFAGVDITAPGPGRLLVGIDNEPDLYHYNFPMLQSGTGDPIFASNGNQIGTRVTGSEFTQRMIMFANRVKQIAPQAQIVGPSHYHYDGFTMWHQTSSPVWSDKGRWFMDDFLADVKVASQTAGVRLLDTWDFHWYPQRVFNGVYVWNLDQASRAMTQAEIDAVVQGPRSYWDTTYDEQSWITSTDHLGGPAYIVGRTQARLAAGYPGTKLGVTEYFPGGRNHIASGIATADTLGVFSRMGVEIAAMWPVGGTGALAFPFGGIKLLRNANGTGTVRYAETDVRVEHPEIAPTSVYAASDTPNRVTVLVINKTNSSRRVGLRAFNSQKLARVDAYRIDAGHSSPFLAQQDTLTKNNAYAYNAPPMSATMLVFQAP